MAYRGRFAFLALTLLLPFVAMADEAGSPAAAVRVDFQWSATIPMRDGVRLHATVYTPRDQKAPAPCIFTLTPYIAQSYHDRGLYFAAHGFPFLAVDVRGRGDSEGRFEPFIQEAKDGYDVVEWLARQPYCNGKVAMSGGSYTGYDQWATAKEFPPHLATIVPTAAPYAGVDFIRKDGSSILLTKDLQRARYRESSREAKAITTRKPLLYVFKGFTFTSRRIESGSRLRLVIAPVNSIYSQKNYNSGGDVSAESMKDARVVTVTLHHDRTHPSTLFVPIGREE